MFRLAVRPPVRPDAELRVLEPFRGLVICQQFQSGWNDPLAIADKFNGLGADASVASALANRMAMS